MADSECSAVEPVKSPQALAVPDRILTQPEVLQLNPSHYAVLASGKRGDRTLQIASL